MQINPHFLFNSLHSIAALATLDGARAREMCIKLSDFLRSSLGLGQRESIPLREELALARSYLEVEQVRFGERAAVEEEIDPGCEDCAIPVLLLQPLVENAVKHGIAGLVEGGAVRLGGAAAARACDRASRTDSIPNAPRAGSAWEWAAHVRRRLELRYGGTRSMEARGRKASIAWSCGSPASLPSLRAAARSRSGSPAAACRRYRIARRLSFP